MPDDPKAILLLAQKKHAAAKEALAESERIIRFKKLLDEEEKKLMETANLEDKAEMRQLADNQAQKLVIPRRIEQCAAQQTAAGISLVETSEGLQRLIAELLAAETEKRLDEWEKKLLPDCPNWTESNGEVRRPARALAGSLSIFSHLSARVRPSTVDAAVCDPIRCHNEPEQALAALVAHVEEQMLILHKYFAAGKTFRDPDFGKAA